MSQSSTPMPSNGRSPEVLDAYRPVYYSTEVAPPEGLKCEATVRVRRRRATELDLIDLMPDDAITLATQLLLAAADAQKTADRAVA